MRMAGLLYFVEGFGSVAAGFEEKDLMTKRNQLVRERETGNAATNDADRCAKEIAAGCAAVELSEIDLHASGEAWLTVLHPAQNLRQVGPLAVHEDADAVDAR